MASGDPSRRRVLLADLRENAILKELDPSGVATLLEHGYVSMLPVRDRIYYPGEPILRVCFPLTCVISIVNRMKDGSQIEVGTIGREGVCAIPLILGATSSTNETYCQVPGDAVVIEATHFKALTADQNFQLLLNRFVHGYLNVLGQLAACNRLHNVYERCARWLLMSQDRVNSSRIALTHEYLGMMLGTQRSGVTIAVGTLHRAGFIEHTRGFITILDREGLINAACECYEVTFREFRDPDR